MTKKKTMKNIKTPNKFWDGGAFNENFRAGFSKAMKLPNGSGFKDMFSAANLGNALGTALPGMAGALGGVAGGLISNGFSTTGGQVLSGIGDAAMMFNPIIGGAIKAASGLVNRGFGTKWDNEGLAKAESQIEGLNSFQSGASDYDTLAQDFSRIGSMNKTIKASDLGKDGWFVNRTANKANELNTDLGNAYNYAMRNANNVADNIAGNTLANLERNYAALGGPIDTAYVNSRPANFVSRLKDKNRRYIRDWEDPRFITTHKLGAEYDENGIPFIYPAVQEINGQLIDFTRPPYTFGAGIESAIRNRDTVQMRSLEDAINFTEKYKGYYPKFAYGGQTHGSDFTNGLMFINNGGTHENNPYEGVPISMDQEGNPNLVEEGEVIWNDYVFSNRLKVPKSIQKKYKLGKGEMTFAEAVDKLSKESKERPNDVISKRGLNSTLLKLAEEQEQIRQKSKNKESNLNKFASGGPEGIYYTEDEDDNYYIQSTGSKTAGINPDVVGLEYKLPSLIEKEKPIETEKPIDMNTPTWLRYAPVVGSAINTISAFSQKPDYTNANAIIKAAQNAKTPIKFNPIGDYLTYNPFDTEYHTNQLRALSGATRRNIMNTSGGNRATAMAGILAADNNTMNQMGDLYRKAAEYNLEQRHKVADFNRATNITNSEGLFKADVQNQQAALSGLSALMQGYNMKEQIDRDLGKSRSVALTGLFNNIGNIGREAVLLSLIKNNPGLLYELSLNGNGVTYKTND